MDLNKVTSTIGRELLELGDRDWNMFRWVLHWQRMIRERQNPQAYAVCDCCILDSSDLQISTTLITRDFSCSVVQLMQFLLLIPDLTVYH